MAGQRDTFYRPAPIYDLPGFSIANLPQGQSLVVLDGVSADPSVSALFAPGGAEGFEVTVETSGITADVTVLNEDGTTVTKVTGCGHGKQFSVSWFDNRVNVIGKRYQIKVDNFSAAGTVTVKYSQQ